MTHLASASAGAIVSAFIRVPTDTLKHRVQAYLLPDVWRVNHWALTHDCFASKLDREIL